MIETMEILIGVFVSSLAKNGTAKILIRMKDGSPNANAERADPVRLTSSILNSPSKIKYL